MKDWLKCIISLLVKYRQNMLIKINIKHTKHCSKQNKKKVLLPVNTLLWHLYYSIESWRIFRKLCYMNLNWRPCLNERRQENAKYIFQDTLEDMGCFWIWIEYVYKISCFCWKLSWLDVFLPTRMFHWSWVWLHLQWFATKLTHTHITWHTFTLHVLT